MPRTQDTAGKQEKTRDPALVAFGQFMRQRRGAEQAYVLAARTGITPASIYKIEAGDGGHFKTVLKLAKALGIESIPVT